MSNSSGLPRDWKIRSKGQMEMNEMEAIFGGAQRTPEPTGSPFLSFDLKSELHRLRTEDHPWQAGRNAKILVKYPDFRILLVALHPGAHLAEHRGPGAISVQTISGHVLFRAAGRAFDLPEGQMLTLEREIPHDIEALAESAVLVTIVLAKKQKVKLLYFAAGLRQLRRLEEFDYDHFSRGGT